MRVEPFAAALPREFQRAFTPVERQQVIRVEFLSVHQSRASLAKRRSELDEECCLQRVSIRLFLCT